ncbi:hypothetical protein [Anthocerotibacter panamensis]|uniref:hypothetical protein n=1 Tax=Anthocerotibacter panamensis TaxID=2857077 RepID=UPI001C406543|nr:hypothetical protein [Anthocerotibacter panamensis]
MHSPLPKPRSQLFPWPIEWLLYLIATANILLVVFDTTYFSVRDFYLTNDYVDLKPLVQRYDPVKAVEPNRVNARYVATAQTLIATYRQNPQAPQITGVLKSLREQSQFLVDNDPYERVGKTGILERLKNRMRRRMGLDSAKQSFFAFWSKENLSEDAFRFYETKMKPLLEANYFRGYGEDGEFVDEFWRIDLWFIGIFALELAVRGLYMSRTLGIRYQEALSLRWYDFFWLTFTVHWQWLRLLRFIPYTVRSYQLGAPFSKVVDYLKEQYLQSLAERVSDLIVVQLIDELEESIRQTDFAAMLTQPNASSNQINPKLGHFLEEQTHSLVHTILPAVEPEVVRLLQHTVLSALSDNPGYKVLRPLLGRLPEAAVAQFIHNLYSTTLTTLQGTGKTDPQTQNLVDDLTYTFNQHLATELQAQNTMADLQDILITLLESTKSTYINRSTRGIVATPSRELARTPVHSKR